MRVCVQWIFVSKRLSVVRIFFRFDVLLLLLFTAREEEKKIGVCRLFYKMVFAQAWHLCTEFWFCSWKICRMPPISSISITNEYTHLIWIRYGLSITSWKTVDNVNIDVNLNKKNENFDFNDAILCVHKVQFLLLLTTKHQLFTDVWPFFSLSLYPYRN